MIKPRPRIVDLSEVEPNVRRGGDLRAMLTPATVGSTSGFMGVAIVQPGDRIGEHYHPYSEEFVYVVCGDLEVDLDGDPHPLRPEQGLMIPAYMRHRFRNVGKVEARIVFHLGPLAPRPQLGHVDTEGSEQVPVAAGAQASGAEAAGAAADGAVGAVADVAEARS